jgi:hypothetical protein
MTGLLAGRRASVPEHPTGEAAQVIAVPNWHGPISAGLITDTLSSCSSGKEGAFGISDEPLLALITGKLSPGAHLPFELPSSVEAVKQQKSDLPHDSQSPLFPLGFGLHY